MPPEFGSAVSDDGRRVSLVQRGLTSVPEWLADLTALVVLDLHGNQLTAVPEWLGNLASLSHLDLHDNQMTTVPDPLRFLTSLTSLDLGANQLTAVPEWLGNLASLTELKLGDNLLTAVPSSLGSLTNLKWLDLHSNHLTAVPSSLGNLTNIKSLDLYNNELTVIPPSLRNLKGLNLNRNLNPPAEMLQTPKPRQEIPIDEQSDTKESEVRPALPNMASVEDGAAWPGELLDRTWVRLRPLFVPSVSLDEILAAVNLVNRSDSAATILQLYTWERERLLILAKGTAGAAITVLTGLIAAAVEGKFTGSVVVLFLAAALVVGLLLWGCFLLAGLRRIAKEYATAINYTTVLYPME